MALCLHSQAFKAVSLQKAYVGKDDGMHTLDSIQGTVAID